MLKTLISLSALFLSFALLCLSHGLQNTLLGVRATLEQFPDGLIGLMMSGYFVGFLGSTLVTPRLIERVGQIRTFAACASLFSVTSLLHVLWLDPYAWIALRLLHGFSMAALYIVIESWLNALSTSENRGRILSAYMLINFLCLGLGQLFMVKFDPMDFTLFALTSVLASFSLVPLLLSRTQQPVTIATISLPLRTLIRTSPLATFGAAVTGLLAGAFWGLAAVYFTKIGLKPANIAWFLGLTYIGGLVFQWPIGYMSDLLNRRVAIALCSLISIGTSLGMIHFSAFEHAERITYLLPLAVLFGGFYYPLYSLSIALANDFMKPEQFTQASARLLFLHGGGAIAGPVLATSCMSIWGDAGLFYLLIALFASLLLFSLVRMASGRPIPAATTEPFVPVPRTVLGVTTLDPRTEIPAEEVAPAP